MVSESTTGILSNHPNRLEATQNMGADAFKVFGSQYTGGEAAGCNIPNGVIFDKSFKKRDIEGYYAIRVFYDTDVELGPFDNVMAMEIYEDGVLKVWNTGDHNDGKIMLYFTGNNTVLGSRIVLWFDPNKEYRIMLKVAPERNDCVVNVDYLQFTQVHHANPFASWINSSEVVGGELWMFDTGSDSVTLSNSSYGIKSVLFNYTFKKVWYADATAIWYDGTMQASLSSEPGTRDINVVVRQTDNVASSYTINFRWFVLGLVELPMVRPL